MSEALMVTPTERSKSLPQEDLERLFPLPLTPFERLMRDDDHPGYPRTFVVVMELDGALDRKAFEIAIEQVIERNPLLSAVVKKEQWWRIPFPKDQILWNSSTLETEVVSFDLKRQPGFMISGNTNGTTSEIRLAFHHAVCDGQGARRVIVDFSVIYSRIISPESKPIPLDVLNYDRLRHRGDFPAHQESPEITDLPKKPVSLFQRCRTIYEFVSQNASPLRNGTKKRIDDDRGIPHVFTAKFDRAEVNQFRDRLRGTRITLNDIAIAHLLNTIATWNRSHGDKSDHRLYRILVPVDLRKTEDEKMPAANRMSLVFITRPARLCQDWPQLVATIRAEMDYIEKHGCRYNLVRVLPLLQAIPGLVPFAVRLPVCFSTAVLTNLGNVLRKIQSQFPEDQGRPVVGNVRFIRAGGAPPIRPKTGLGIGITISTGEIVLYFQFDSRVFSRSDSQTFMKLFVDNWRNWAADLPPFQSPDLAASACSD